MDNMYRKPIIENLPPFMRKYKEIKEILNAEDTEIDELNANFSKVLKNAFIDDCDEFGIRKYEKLLKIVHNSTETLESRKSRVKVRWNDNIPYTKRTLIEKLNVLCGVNSYDLDITDEYYMHLSINLSLFSQIRTLEDVLDDMLPMNVFYEIENIIECNAHDETVLTGTVSFTELIEIGG